MTLGIKDNELLNDPWHQFEKWYLEAQQCEEISYPHAFTLSTLDSKGYPEGRIVLMKHFDRLGLVFYTNLNSTKGTSVKIYPKAGLSFYWDPLGRQIRMQGEVSMVSPQEADEYFATRSRESQLGAWASSQSRPIATRKQLVDKVEYYKEQFRDKTIFRPPYWSGLRINPVQFEFWQFGNARLHDRFVYSRVATDQWTIQRLQP